MLEVKEPAGDKGGTPPTGSVPSSTPAEAVQRVRAVCRNCERVNNRRSRRGYYWTCRHCGSKNIGPALLEQLAKPTEAGSRRRAARRLRDQEAAAAAARPQPAPVRRKRPAAAAAAPASATSSAQPPSAPAAPPAPPRGGLLSRALDAALYGAGE